MKINIKFKNSLGIVQIPIIIGLVVMAVALPLVTKMVQKSQENRSSASNYYSCKLVTYADPNCSSEESSTGEFKSQTDQGTSCSWNNNILKGQRTICTDTNEPIINEPTPTPITETWNCRLSTYKDGICKERREGFSDNDYTSTSDVSYPCRIDSNTGSWSKTVCTKDELPPEEEPPKEANTCYDQGGLCFYGSCSERNKREISTGRCSDNFEKCCIDYKYDGDSCGSSDECATGLECKNSVCVPVTKTYDCPGRCSLNFGCKKAAPYKSYTADCNNPIAEVIYEVAQSCGPLSGSEGADNSACTPSNSKKPIGSPCSSASECESGYCSSYLTREGDQMLCGVKPQDPREGEIGSPCTSNSQCNSGYCHDFGSGIGKKCANDIDACPSDSSCTAKDQCTAANGKMEAGSGRCKDSGNVCCKSAPSVTNKYKPVSCNNSTGKYSCQSDPNGSFDSQSECEMSVGCKQTYWGCNSNTYTCSSGLYEVFEDCEYSNGTFTKDCYDTKASCDTGCKAPVPGTKYAKTSCNTVTGNFSCHASATGTFNSESECERSEGCDAAIKFKKGECNIATGKFSCTQDAAAGTFLSQSECEEEVGCDMCTKCANDPNAKARGDFNCDGKTNLVDFSIWKSEFFGGGNQSKNTWAADANCDSKVTDADYSNWLNGRN